MKIIVIDRNEYLHCIGRIMRDEGDEVSLLKDLKIKDPECDLIITDRKININNNIPQWGGDESVPLMALKIMGFNTEKKTSQTKAFFVIKHFDKVNGWGNQTIISLGLLGMMNNNLGLLTETGYALRYVSNKTRASRILTENNDLNKFLININHNGFVCMKGWIDENSYSTESIKTFIPQGILYGILQGVNYKLSDFFLQHLLLKESWTCSLLLTRYPYPFKLQTERCFIEKPRHDIIKYIMFPFIRHNRNSYYTDSTIIGFCTSWDNKLSHANKRVLMTAKSIHIPNLQYRTDLSDQTKLTWFDLLNNELVN